MNKSLDNKCKQNVQLYFFSFFISIIAYNSMFLSSFKNHVMNFLCFAQIHLKIDVILCNNGLNV